MPRGIVIDGSNVAFKLKCANTLDRRYLLELQRMGVIKETPRRVINNSGDVSGDDFTQRRRTPLLSPMTTSGSFARILDWAKCSTDELKFFIGNFLFGRVEASSWDISSCKFYEGRKPYLMKPKCHWEEKVDW
ncbi:hypothetical protein CHUAL_006694 [Chamberlinius hualienensis]